MKTVVVKLKLDSKKAEKGFERVGDIIEEQKDITQEFREELIRLERQMKQTPKGSLGQQKALKKRIDGLKTAIKEQGVALKRLNIERSKVGAINTQRRAQDKLNKGYFATKGSLTDINRLTAEMALKLTAVRDITKGVIVQIKAFAVANKLAFAVTIIGAFVIAITIIASFWDEITSFVKQ